MNKLYKALKNLRLEIEEIDYTKKTDHFYWDVLGRRNAKQTDYYKTFDTKDAAVIFLKNRIESKIYTLQGLVEHYKKDLLKLNEYNK